jgi:hypothetical protein
VRTLSEQLQTPWTWPKRSRKPRTGTRVAVVERALEDARTRKEKNRTVARFDTRHFELTTRLQEAETSLTGWTIINRPCASARTHPAHPDRRATRVHRACRKGSGDGRTGGVTFTGGGGQQRSVPSPMRNARLDRCSWSNCGSRKALDNLRQKITDDFGLVMFDYAAGCFGSGPAAVRGNGGGTARGDRGVPRAGSAACPESHHLRRMGPINPEAKQEFDRESERYPS